MRGILITHEHTDHIGGLSVFLKKNPVPVYAGDETLLHLEEQGILKRVYGGAIPWKRPAPGIDARKNVDKDEKYLVASKAVELVHPGELIAIDGGTTNTLFVSLLPVSIRLRVVTNSFPVVEELRKRPNADVTFLGGHYNKGSQTTVGELVLSQLKDYHFDQCFMGAYAVDAKRGVSVPYPYEDEAPVKKYLAENCRELNVLCDNSKLDKEAILLLAKENGLEVIGG